MARSSVLGQKRYSRTGAGESRMVGDGGEIGKGAWSDGLRGIRVFAGTLRPGVFHIVGLRYWGQGKSWLVPLPPSKVSFPLPPKSLSSPDSPKSWSSEAPPSIWSLPEPP